MNESIQVLSGQGRRAHDGVEIRNGDTLFQRLCDVARDSIDGLRHTGRKTAFFEKLHVNDVGLPSGCGWAPELVRWDPIAIKQGFEDNAGIEGGFWPSATRKDDALVFLRFASGTVDLPLHVHEFSDRFIAIDAGVGLFHYAPSADQPDELRSLIVQAGDVVMLTRGLLHTFTASFEDLVLLSYHAPFFAFDDARQFTIPEVASSDCFSWTPGSVATRTEIDRRRVSHLQGPVRTQETRQYG